MNTIELGIFGIVITLDADGMGGTISDELHEVVNTDMDSLEWDGPEDQVAIEAYNNCIDGITSMILGHAVAGLDVTSPSYLEGVETAVQSCGQQYA